LKTEKNRRLQNGAVRELGPFLSPRFRPQCDKLIRRHSGPDGPSRRRPASPPLNRQVMTST